jgi:hypothetical protein
MKQLVVRRKQKPDLELEEMPVLEKVPEKPTARSYRDGAEGFIIWCEHKVCIPVYPPGSDIPIYFPIGELPDNKHEETGRSPKDFWEHFKEIAREALEMENNRFKYNLLTFCWMRGEGKSLFVCLIQLWKFFNWPRQNIVLGANSKDQVKFVHFDIMVDIIQNSPKLLADLGGQKNIKEKEIRMKDGDGQVRSIIRPISSFTGIVSNITGYTFSEIFAMKNPKFFTQLDGSIRNIPNALGCIDSTVSDKTHVLYKLYVNALIEKKTKKVFFSYRRSRMPDGDPADFWHPYMTKDQLADYKAKFPFGEFERYFLNMWEAGQVRVFTNPMIEEVYALGCDGQMLNHKDLRYLLNKKQEVVEAIETIAKAGLTPAIADLNLKIDDIMARVAPVESIYKLFGQPDDVSQMLALQDLNALGDKFDTDWAILAGSDFGDPYAQDGRARTILYLIAKGLPGSRSNPNIYLQQAASPPYVYLIIGFFNIRDHSLGAVKEILDKAHTEYEGLDSYCSERFGNWDSQAWCEERGVKFEPVFASYDRQKECFKGLYEIIDEGRLKSPQILVPGVSMNNILSEELSVFMHDPLKRWFGSPRKMEKYGEQDDSIFALGWGLYGGRELSSDEFRIRRSYQNFGWTVPNKANLGAY